MQFATVNKSDLLEEYIVKELLPQYGRGERIPSELELARELRTSRPTIHKVLSNLTAKGVLYRENGVGTFVSGPRTKSHVVSVVIPSPSTMVPSEHYAWFNVQFLLEGFAQVAQSDGFATNLVFLHPDGQSVVAGTEHLLRQETEAYLFPEFSGYRGMIEGLMAHGRICLTRWAKPTGVTHTVYGQKRLGVHEVMAHFVAMGRRRIALFGAGHEEDMPYERERYLGYCEGLERAGIELRPELLRTSEGYPRHGREATRRMLAEGVVPDAIFGGSDMRTFGIMEALVEAGVRVPEDIAVVGADNLTDCQLLDPPLASLDYPLREMGEVLYEIYQEAAANPRGEVIDRAFPCRFIRRASCGATSNPSEVSS